jgi:hypothetical protein
MGNPAAVRRRIGVVEEVRKLYWMWHMDRRSRAPIQRKLWLWRRGFTVLSGELYGLPRRDLQDFLPDFHATHLIKPINASLAFYRHNSESVAVFEQISKPHLSSPYLLPHSAFNLR